MKSKPRCKKCGRVLRSPTSIARGMGPVCAGDTGRAGRQPQARVRRSAGRTYDAIGRGTQQSLLPVQIAEQPEPKRTKRERIRRTRAPEETSGRCEQRRNARSTRKAHFLARESIQIGINTRTREPVIYSPVGVDGWIDEQGRQVSHEFLQSYLQRYQFI